MTDSTGRVEESQTSEKTEMEAAAGNSNSIAPVFGENTADDFKRFVKKVRKRAWRQLLATAPFELPIRKKRKIIRDADGLLVLPFYAHLNNSSDKTSTSKLLCCITQKSKDVWVKCPRKASKRFLTEALQDVVLQKKLPFAVHSEGANHLRTCRYHERLIEQFKEGFSTVQLKPTLFDDSDVEKTATDSEEDNESDEWITSSEHSETDSLKEEPFEKWEYEDDDKVESPDVEAARHKAYHQIVEQWRAMKNQRLERQLKRAMQQRTSDGEGESSDDEQQQQKEEMGLKQKKTIRRTRTVRKLEKPNLESDDKHQSKLLELETQEAELEEGDKVIDEIVEEELIAEEDDRSENIDNGEQVLEETRVQVKYVKSLDDVEGELTSVIWQKDGKPENLPSKQYKVKLKDGQKELPDGIYKYVPKSKPVTKRMEIEANSSRDDDLDLEELEDDLTDELEINELKAIAAEHGLVLEQAEQIAYDEYPPDLYGIQGVEEEKPEESEQDQDDEEEESDSDVVSETEQDEDAKKKRRRSVHMLLEEEPNQKKKVKTQDLLSNLSAASLRRYRKYFGIQTKSGMTKGDMLNGGVCEHFDSLPNPRHTIPQFIHINRSEQAD